MRKCGRLPRLRCGVLIAFSFCAVSAAETIPNLLPGTEPLHLPADWRELQRQQLLQYLDRRIHSTPALRDRDWKPALSSAQALKVFAGQRRTKLATMTGFELHAAVEVSRKPVSDSASLRVELVELTAADKLFASALLRSPKERKATEAIIVVPPDLASPAEFANSDPLVAKWLGEGKQIAVLTTSPRDSNHPICKNLMGYNRRLILHRLAFNVGRTLTGIEAEQAAMLREYLARDAGVIVAIYGKGQGGMTALFAAALDARFVSATVSDYFSARENEVAQQPVDRSIYGLLLQFGDAELAALIAPRRLTILGGADRPAVLTELDRARRYYQVSGQPAALSLSEETAASSSSIIPAASDQSAVDHNFEMLHTYVQKLNQQSEAERYEYWGLLKPGDPAAKSARIRQELITWMGVPTDPPAPMHPRSHLLLITDKYVAYEVMLGVLDGVEVYGHLLVPRGLNGRLPAVICEHGLDGQPKDISGAGENAASPYHEFGRHLAERGYVVFAPYLTVPLPSEEKITPIVQRARPVGMLRTALEVRKLSRVVDYLQSLTFVDSEHIGYYGLSYGGYSTIWMGPVETRLKVIIVSGHFNDWRAKVSNEDLATSYMKHPDEDMFSFNALRRFTHPELIAAMLPRPVMIEFANHDTTTTPEWHERAWRQAEEIARALHASGRLARDAFQGVHEIGGMRTFDWLDQWLRPTQPTDRSYTYLLWPSSRDLPGLADDASDTVPFDSIQLGSRGVHVLFDSFRTGKENQFHGLGLRLSRVGNPPALVVKYGSKEGLDDLGTARILPSNVGPLYDLWYRADVKPVSVEASRTYFVELSLEHAASPGDGYVVYGRRPLGGHSFPSSFYFAYRPVERLSPPGQEPTFEFVRSYLAPPADPVFSHHAPAQSNEIAVDSSWTIQPKESDELVTTAAAGLRRFLKTCCGIVPAASGTRRIILQIASSLPGVNTTEGYRIHARAGEIAVAAETSRGLMRGIYALEDSFRHRQAAIVRTGEIVRNARFARRITTSILPGGERYTETSRTMLYTDGLLERISRDGFNPVWIWFNIEEGATGSKMFPELDDPHALERFARIEDLCRRARRFGIDVYVYLATGYNHHLPDWFWQKYPELKGQGWGPPMCTSDKRTLPYQAEVVRNLFSHAPDIRGMVVIYDSEGFYYCGNSERNRARCPRCSKSTSEALSAQVLTNLDSAMHAAGGSDKELIAWSYGLESWVDKAIPMFPKDIKIQVDFSKGGEVVRDGIHHRTGDYNLTLIGPPDFFERRNRMASQLGIDFITKTEHAVSQEFIFAPYIPAMEQWYRRISKIREYPAAGWFGNWDHYGYLASLPAQLFNQMSFDPPPADMLRDLAEVNYGKSAAPMVLEAWKHFSEGIRQFPYSDAVSRLPGPLQKGPSNPLFLDPHMKNFGRWRAWQNDLDWTKPWGPRVASKYLGIVRDEFHTGAELLARAAEAAPEPSHRNAIHAEWRIARTIEASLNSVLNLIDWLEARDRFWQAADNSERRKIAASLREIALREQANAKAILPILDADSRLGYASEGGGVVRGGLFSPDLVRWKIGEIDDILQRQLPATLAAD